VKIHGNSYAKTTCSEFLHVSIPNRGILDRLVFPHIQATPKSKFACVLESRKRLILRVSKAIWIQHTARDVGGRGANIRNQSHLGYFACYLKRSCRSIDSFKAA